MCTLIQLKNNKTVCFTIETSHEIYSLFSSSMDMLLTQGRVNKISHLFYTRILFIPKFAVNSIELGFTKSTSSRTESFH